MSNNEIIIKVSNSGILLNPETFIAINNTNIPIGSLSFNSNKNIFWKAQMIGFNSFEKCLRIKIIDYSVEDISGFGNQVAKKEVAQLQFERLDWQMLEPLLTYYQKSTLESFIYNTVIKRAPVKDSQRQSNKSNTPLHRSTNTQQNTKWHDILPTPTQIQTKFEIDEIFDISFNDAEFILGYVTFSVNMERFNKVITFKISNNHILPEFEHIKHWFAKKLKIKKFKVSVKIIFSKDDITDTIATSKHIDQITPELIEGIKYSRTQELSKINRPINSEKALYTMIELLALLDKEKNSENAFKQTDNDILKDIINKENIRNKKQIEYLADVKQDMQHIIKFTIDTPFGFLFFIKGLINNHFVWELLNSHATYIWSINKTLESMELQFKRIEYEINTIRTNGREKYKHAYKNNNIDKDHLIFNSINHKEIDSNSILGFQVWKAKIDKYLI